MNTATPKSNPLAIAAIVVFAASMWFAALLLIARPSHATEKIAGIQAIVGQTQAIRRQGRAEAPLNGWSMCAEAGPAGDAVNTAVANLAKANGLTLSNVSAKPLPASSDGRLDVQITAAGPYLGLMNFLGGLGDLKPTLFVKAVDIKPKVQATELVLSGSSWCETP